MDRSPKERHERIHREASEKVWDDGRWRVAPLTDQHRDQMVIEFIDKKFRDSAIWVTIDALDLGFVPDFGDKDLFREPTTNLDA